MGVGESAPRPGRLYPAKNPVPIVQEAGWAPGPVWTGGKSRPHRNSIPVRPARSQSLCDWATRLTVQHTFLIKEGRVFMLCWWLSDRIRRGDIEARNLCTETNRQSNHDKQTGVW